MEDNRFKDLPACLTYFKKDKVIYFTGTRVSLDIVVNEWEKGNVSAKEIVEMYQSLDVKNVMIALDYYEKNKSRIDNYIEERDLKANKMHEEIDKQNKPHDKKAVKKLLYARKFVRSTLDALDFHISDIDASIKELRIKLIQLQKTRNQLAKNFELEQKYEEEVKIK